MEVDVKVGLGVTVAVTEDVGVGDTETHVIVPGELPAGQGPLHAGVESPVLAPYTFAGQIVGTADPSGQ